MRGRCFIGGGGVLSVFLLLSVLLFLGPAEVHVPSDRTDILEQQSAGYQRASNRSTPTAAKDSVCRAVAASLRTQQGFIFIKTHKTAGSTLSGLLWRKLCEIDRYNCFLPQYSNPGRIWDLTKDWPFVSRGLGSRNKTYPFDAWLHHVYFSRKLFDVVPSARIPVSIVRRPSARFQSAWIWYDHKSVLKMPLQTFIEKAASKEISACNRHLTKVFQCYDFKYRTGLDATTEELLGTQFTKYSDEFVSQFEQLIRHVESGRVFLLIADRFDESLVVLAHLVQWPLHQLLYLSKKVSQKDNNSSDIYLTAEELNLADAIQPFDTSLHKTANAMLEVYIDCLGRELIAADTSRFKRARSLLANACANPIEGDKRPCEELERDNRAIVRGQRGEKGEYFNMMKNLEKRFFV